MRADAAGRAQRVIDPGAGRAACRRRGGAPGRQRRPPRWPARPRRAAGETTGETATPGSMPPIAAGGRAADPEASAYRYAPLVVSAADPPAPEASIAASHSAGPRRATTRWRRPRRPRRARARSGRGGPGPSAAGRATPPHCPARAGPARRMPGTQADDPPGEIVSGRSSPARRRPAHPVRYAEVAVRTRARTRAATLARSPRPGRPAPPTPATLGRRPRRSAAAAADCGRASRLWTGGRDIVRGSALAPDQHRADRARAEVRAEHRPQFGHVQLADRRQRDPQLRRRPPRPAPRRPGGARRGRPVRRPRRRAISDTSRASARVGVRTFSSATIWPSTICSSGLTDSEVASSAVAAPIRPPRRRYSSVST